MRKLFFLFLALVATTSLWAHDFDGDGIYYNILADKTNEVEVTSGSTKYSGSVTILSTVTYKGTTYSVTSIGEGAFRNCSSLTSITIPNSVTSIGLQAFRNCSSLTSITIPNSVTSIGVEAFYDCSSLTTPVYNAHCFAYMPTSFKGAYVIPEGIKQIAGGAFWNCSSLTSITIPNSVTSIGDCAFSNCSSFVSMVVESGNTKYDSRDNCNAIIETATNILIAGCQNTIIPNSVTSIGNRAFQDCSALTSITIPNSVTSIGETAFSNCSSLTSITIPNSVTSIGNYAFSSCSSLTSVTIPNSVTSIGTGAFSWCYSLTTPVYNAHCFAYMPTSFKGAYVIPEGIKQIAGGAFEDCSSLTSVTIPNSVTSIGEYAFSSCSSLVSMVVESGNTKYDSRDNCNAIIETATNILIAVCQNTIIPNSVTSIGKSAFYRCASLTSITIPNSVTSIGETAFSNCSSLTSITIPNSVTSIGDAAFVYCRSLKTVICEAIEVPELGNDVFYNMPVSEATLYVPAQSLDDYKAAEQWKEFGTILPIEGESEEEIELQDTEMTIVFTNSEDNDSEIYRQTITIKIPAAPEIEGFTFLGWQPVATLIKDAITIQAIYEANAPASAPEVYVNPANPAQKLLRNGQVYILKDDKTYTIMGAQIQ